MRKIKISKATVDRLSFAGKGEQIDYFDAALKGFGCRVSATAKDLFCAQRVNGKLTRVTLGKHGIKTAEQARKDAIDTLSDLGNGIDVNREKARARERGISLREVLDRYFITRQELKPRTVTTYRDLFRLYLHDWMNRPIEEITKEMVAERHLKVARDAGKAAANNVMRTLRAIYNFANELLDDSLPVNPVKRLSNTRQWFVIERRQTVVHEFDLPKWFEAVNKLENPTIRITYCFSFLPGHDERKQPPSNGRMLTWKTRPLSLPRPRMASRSAADERLYSPNSFSAVKR